jgi:hypothetical protein
VAGIILVLCIFSKRFRISATLSATLVLFAALLVASHSFRFVSWVVRTNKDGQGYASRTWTESDTIAALKPLASEVPIYSNGSDAIHYLTGRPGLLIPEKINHGTGLPNLNYDREVEAMKKDIMDRNGVLVYLHNLPERSYLPSENELRSRLSPQVRSFSDGSIFEASKGERTMTPQFTTMQTMLMLAFIADSGALLKKHNCEVEQKLSVSVGDYLKRLKPVQDEWELVWGPCLYKFPGIAKYTDNTVYVVQKKQDPSEYAIAISGTNPYELTAWVLEDFLVAKTVPWAYGHPPAGARISESAELSMRILKDLKPCPGVRGENLQLIDFLKGTAGISKVTVTGHSLGGEMASTTALWLSDTQGDLWDPQKQAQVSAYTFAAPTAGNAIWMNYFHQQLGDNAHRIWNSLDVVPHVWQLSDLKQIPNLYEPQIKAPVLLKGALKILIQVVKNKDYTQMSAVAADQQPLKGSVNTDPKWAEFIKQLEYQHVDAYIKMLDVPDANELLDFLRDTRPKP